MRLVYAVLSRHSLIERLFSACGNSVSSHNLYSLSQEDNPLEHDSKPHPSLTADSNMNMSEQEKEIICWHQRLGHVSVRKVQWLMRQGLLATSERTRRIHQAPAKLIQRPMCTACQYAKQRRKTTPGTTQVRNKEQDKALNTNELFPGSLVLVDHFHCNPKHQTP